MTIFSLLIYSGNVKKSISVCARLKTSISGTDKKNNNILRIDFATKRSKLPLQQMEEEQELRGLPARQNHMAKPIALQVEVYVITIKSTLEKYVCSSLQCLLENSSHNH